MATCSSATVCADASGTRCGPAPSPIARVRRLSVSGSLPPIPKPGFILAEINCGSPGILPNGWLEGTRTTLHAVVTFRCQEGMTFEGPSYRTICQADGRWSHPLPKCYGESVSARENQRQANGHDFSPPRSAASFRMHAAACGLRRRLSLPPSRPCGILRRLWLSRRESLELESHRRPARRERARTSRGREVGGKASKPTAEAETEPVVGSFHAQPLDLDRNPVFPHFLF